MFFSKIYDKIIMVSVYLTENENSILIAGIAAFCVRNL